MIGWLRAKFGEPDLAAFFEGLSPVKVGQSGYTELDRYQDFRQVFSTPTGRRVLHQIIDHCEGRPASEHDAEQTHRAAFRNGLRSGGLWIIAKMNAVPLDKPEQADGS